MRKISEKRSVEPENQSGTSNILRGNIISSYPTYGKGNSSSQLPLDGNVLVSRRVVVGSGLQVTIFLDVLLSCYFFNVDYL